MRVVVVGASGNVGTSVVASLSADPRVEEIVGLARRLPELELPKLRWAQADIVADDLEPHFRAAAAIVHLAWAIQPQHDRQLLERINVLGSERVFAAAAAAGVGSLVYASSVGAYAVGPKDRFVDESWSTAGIEGSIYSRQKSQVERILDRFEAAQPRLRVVRLRPGLIFKAEAASEIRRLFLGPLFPRFLANPRLIPIVPRTPRLRFQAVHADDVGDAYRLAVIGEARGAFNIAAEPAIGPPELARLLGAREVPVPPRVLRAAAHLGWRAHLQPSGPGWVDMALGVPLMDTARARAELGWEPRSTALEALAELLRGLREGRGAPTPPLDPRTGGPARLGELATGVGERQ